MAAPDHALQLKTFPPPRPDQMYPEGGYQPTLAQFHTQQAGTIPTQTHPPGYEYAGQTSCQPITDTSTASTVVTAQPTVASVVSISPPEEDHTPVAIAALVLSTITLICCGVCSVPALILAILAMVTRGKTQKTHAGVSIGLSIAVIVVSALLAIIYGITYAVLFSSLTSSSSCYAYYSSAYRTRCFPYNYSTTGSCVYYPAYPSAGSYCPT